MERDFDKVVDRHNTDCAKYDFAAEYGKPEGLLPLWVADMDFQAPKAVTEKLEEVSRLGIFGYSDTKEAYFNAVHNWYLEHFGWEVQPEWLVKTPGVVFAVATAVRALTEPGDGVMIQQPVYYPFGNVIRDNDRKVVNCPLMLKDGKYGMDFEDMEKKLASGKVKLFILCSPHNPVGRVWTEEELRITGELCLKYNVPVVSDEIHCDFTYPGYRHHIFASLDERFADNCVICTAPSKTFNLAGLQASNLFIPNQEIRRKIRRAIKRTGYGGLNQMGIAACQAAYERGRQWLNELKDYLKGNLDFLREFVEERLPGVKLIEPQGTYLVWLDFRELGMTPEQQDDFIVNTAGLWLDTGTMFGEEGAGFERINIACPRATLTEALERLERALKNL